MLTVDEVCYNSAVIIASTPSRFTTIILLLPCVEIYPQMRPEVGAV